MAAARNNVPAVYTQSDFARDGGLPNGEVADSLGEAKAAFRAAWERHKQELQKSASQASFARNHGDARGDLALNVFVYPTTVETVGAAIGLFVVMAAGLVLPLWLILRVAVWVTRALGAEETHGERVSACPTRRGEELTPLAHHAT